ncbi:MAG: hypothetical protein RLZZ505_403 [Verrucomicrobiota bacterium]|jgi:hypothetical protein
MNAQPESEQLQNFHQRLSHWVSGQGFWFQLRYSLAGGGGKGALTFHLLRLSMRVGLFLLLIAGGFFIFLIKQTESDSYRMGVKASFMENLGGDEFEMRGLVSARGVFSISRLAMTGKEGTFFTELEIRNLKCRRGIFSSYNKEWDPGAVSISRVDLGLRAGSDSVEAAESMANVYFQDTGKLKLQKIVVNEMSMRWGYSERTRGSIIGSHMTADRLPEGWKLRFKGGTFSQNWLKRLMIEELVVQFGRKGLVIEKATFKKNEGYVTLLDVKVKAGERPEVSGKMRMRKMDLASLVPAAVRNYVEGAISAEFNVFGSTNSTEGVGFEGDLVLEGEDSITIRDRIHVLRAISVVDAFNNYRRIDFREGGFHLKTHAGRLEVTGANLVAGDLLRLKGSLTARPATADEAMSYSPSNSTVDDDLVILSDDEMDTKMEITLEGAAKQSEDTKRQGFTKDGEESLFEKLGISLENRRIDEIGAERLSRSMRYEGELEISLPKEAFDKTPKLAEMYPLRDAAGRVLMRVPLEGVIYDLTLKQAEGIYEGGSR